MEFKEVIGHINLDENAVLERFSGNRALMERFIRKFPEDKTYMELCAAVDANGAEEILRRPFCHIPQKTRGEISGGESRGKRVKSLEKQGREGEAPPCKQAGFRL